MFALGDFCYIVVGISTNGIRFGPYVIMLEYPPPPQKKKKNLSHDQGPYIRVIIRAEAQGANPALNRKAQCILFPRFQGSSRAYGVCDDRVL